MGKDLNGWRGRLQRILDISRAGRTSAARRAWLRTQMGHRHSHNPWSAGLVSQMVPAQTKNGRPMNSPHLLRTKES